MTIKKINKGGFSLAQWKTSKLKSCWAVQWKNQGKQGKQFTDAFLFPVPKLSIYLPHTLYTTISHKVSNKIVPYWFDLTLAPYHFREMLSQ